MIFGKFVLNCGGRVLETARNSEVQAPARKALIIKNAYSVDSSEAAAETSDDEEEGEEEEAEEECKEEVEETEQPVGTFGLAGLSSPTTKNTMARRKTIKSPGEGKESAKALDKRLRLTAKGKGGSLVRFLLRFHI